MKNEGGNRTIFFMEGVNPRRAFALDVLVCEDFIRPKRVPRTWNFGQRTGYAPI